MIARHQHEIAEEQNLTEHVQFGMCVPNHGFLNLDIQNLDFLFANPGFGFPKRGLELQIYYVFGYPNVQADRKRERETWIVAGFGFFIFSCSLLNLT